MTTPPSTRVLHGNEPSAWMREHLNRAITAATQARETHDQDGAVVMHRQRDLPDHVHVCDRCDTTGTEPTSYTVNIYQPTPWLFVLVELCPSCYATEVPHG